MKSGTGDRALARALSRFLSDVTEDELQALAEGRATIEVVELPAPDKGRDEDLKPILEEHLQGVLKALNSAKDREEGYGILEGEVGKKSELELLVRMADLPVQRRDRVDDLRDRIVEATIGFRLRSKAIRGDARG